MLYALIGWIQFTLVSDNHTVSSPWTLYAWNKISFYQSLLLIGKYKTPYYILLFYKYNVCFVAHTKSLHWKYCFIFVFRISLCYPILLKFNTKWRCLQIVLKSDIHIHRARARVCVCMCARACMYVYMFVCMYVCINIFLFFV